MKKIFTFVIAYKRGTYIRQMQAVDVNCATIELLKSLVNDDYFNLPYTDLVLNVKAIEEDTDVPVLIDGCQSVWFHMVKIKRNRICLNIVETSGQSTIF